MNPQQRPYASTYLRTAGLPTGSLYYSSKRTNAESPGCDSIAYFLPFFWALRSLFTTRALVLRAIMKVKRSKSAAHTHVPRTQTTHKTP